MVRAELLGAHTHRTLNGVDVHVWSRGGRYLARGRYRRLAFGETLGGDLATASSRLRQLMVEIDNGTFQRRSEARHRPLQHGPVPRLDVRQLVDRYVALVRRLRGKQTARDYLSRLSPVIEYSEGKEMRSRSPWAADLDGNLEFAVGLRAFLFQRIVTPNGQPTTAPRRMSARQIYIVLSAACTMLGRAKQPDLNWLPVTFSNPFSKALIGDRPRRDPLEPPRLPPDVRIDAVRIMDAWQLCTLSWSLILPQRPEELSGLLITDVLRDQRELVFATRWGGDDHNKARQSFRVAYPPQSDPLLNWLIGQRRAGPLLRRRTVSESRRQPRSSAETQDQIVAQYDTCIAGSRPGDVQNEQDRKRLFRRLLLDLGGVSEEDLAKEFKLLLKRVRPGLAARFYDLRGSVSTDLRRAGVADVLRRYITGRSLKREILADYESQDLHADMDRYFKYTRPLLDAIATRAAELNIRLRIRREERRCSADRRWQRLGEDRLL